jgi:Fe-S-cluster formation regulator IscX/YfhJ
VAAMLDLNIPAQPVRGNLSSMPQFIALSSDDVKEILKRIKYFERVKVEVEVKLPETTEGLPKPLVDAVNTLRNAQEYLRNLDFARAIEACRNALYDVTDKVDDKNVIKTDVRKAILDKYEDHAGSVYKTVLEKLEVIIRNTLGIMSKFIHESGRVQFNPGINDATYLCRQVIEIINYLVELSRGR